MGISRVTRLVSHVDKLLLIVPDLSVVSGCNKSNTSGVTVGKVLLTVPELSVVSGYIKSNTSGVTRGQATAYRS